MVKYLLDTNIVIYFLNDTHGVSKNFLIHKNTELGISMLAFSELLYGAYNSTRCEKNLAQLKKLIADIQLIPFCERSAHTFGENKAWLKKKGTIVDDVDLIIGSIAIANDMTLITNNIKHFERIPKLKLENWCA